jgi:5-methylcytosine-specific restriction endonuclease McrA
MLTGCIWLLNRLPARWRPVRLLQWQQRRLAWAQVKKQHLQKEPRCQACGRTGNLEVHHIIPVAVAPTLEFDAWNLITLCASPCHLVFGHLMSYNCYNKDVRRMAAAYRAALHKRLCLEQLP